MLPVDEEPLSKEQEAYRAAMRAFKAKFGQSPWPSASDTPAKFLNRVLEAVRTNKPDGLLPPPDNLTRD